MQSAQVVPINSKIEQRSDKANNRRLRAKQLMLKKDREILENMMTRHIDTPFMREFVEHLGSARTGMFDTFMMMKEELDK